MTTWQRRGLQACAYRTYANRQKALSRDHGVVKAIYLISKSDR